MSQRNATRLQRLVDDVLFAARAEAGRWPSPGGRVDVLLRNLRERARIEGEGTSFTIELPLATERVSLA